MQLKIIKNLFHKKTKSLKTHKDINPEFHWRIILKIYFCISVVLVLFSLYFLNKIKKDEFFNNNEELNNTPVAIDQKMLDSILTSFGEKQNIVNSIKLGDDVFVDPGK